MKILLIAITLSLLSTAFASNRQETGDEGHMTKEERAKAIRMLQDSEKELLNLVSNLTDEQWDYRPSPFRWSAGEVAQHIMLSEGLLFGTVERAMASPVNPDWKAKTEGKNDFLERVLVSRDRRAQAPEPIRPLGKISRAEVMSRFKEARAKTIKFIEETNAPMKAHTVEHPFRVFNTLNAYQWLIYIPLHNMRHNQQIAEVKASSGFPK